MKLQPMSVIALLSLSTLAQGEVSNKGSNKEELRPKGFPALSINVNKFDPLRNTSRTHSVRKGMPEKQVLKLLGKPNQELAPNLVEYRNCAPDQPEASLCDLLVIRYENGKVAEMVFANRPMTELLAMQAIERSTPDKTKIQSALALPDEQTR